MAESMPVEAIAHAVVDGFDETGNEVHNFEETRDRFIESWTSRLAPASRLTALLALDGVYSTDLVCVPHAEDRFTAKMLDISAEVIGLIGEHLSYVKDLAGVPDTSFDEGFAAELIDLIDGPMTALSNKLTTKAQQSVDLKDKADDGESDE